MKRRYYFLLLPCIALAAWGLFAVTERAYRSGYQEGLSEGQIEYIEYYCDVTREQVEDQFRNFGIDGQALIDPCVKYGRQYGIPPVMLAWQIIAESSGNPRAVNFYTSGGKKHTVRGLMQIDWAYWGDFLKKRKICSGPKMLFEIDANIEAGALILAHVAHNYYQGNLYKAFGHYWAGEAGKAHVYLSKVMVLRSK